MSDQAPVQRVSPEDAARLIEHDGHVYLDVRTPAEFSLGHPTGAWNVPIALEAEHGRTENLDFVRIVTAVFAADARLVVGCHSGVRSRRASAQLAAAGFCVVDQRAGYAGSRDAFGAPSERGWHALGLPTSCDALPGRDYRALRARAGL